MKCLIVYKSKTGYTRQYAQWLSESLNCTCIPLKKIASVQLSDYETVIYGGGIYASKINGLKGFKNNAQLNGSQKLIVFGVGSSPQSIEFVNVLKKANFQGEEAQLYYFQGGFDPEKLGFFMKMMLKMVAKNIQKKAEKNPESLTKEDRNFLDFFQSTHVDLDRSNIDPLVEFINC